LDVRSNDAGDLVVTKGDNYDVREKAADGSGGDVRNLGKPVSLAGSYYTAGMPLVLPYRKLCSRSAILGSHLSVHSAVGGRVHG
jgi:hypothetical protein